MPNEKCAEEPAMTKSQTQTEQATNEQEPKNVEELPTDYRGPTILVNQQQREVVYYSLSDSEIETNSQFGCLVNFCLTLFWLGEGFTVSCIVALIQAPPAQPISSPLFWVALVSGFFSLVFLVLTGVLSYFQRRQRKMWKP